MMRRFIFVLVGILAAGLGANGLNALAGAASPSPLRVDDRGRWLVREDGRPVFILADTAWDLAERVRREDVAMYLDKRRAQGFNAITFVCFHPDVTANVYGAAPFEVVKGRMDPTRPLVTPGSGPEKPDQYDYWDHVDYVIEQAGRRGMHVIALPCWGGSAVTGSYSGKPTNLAIFNKDNARTYGKWLGKRYASHPHLIWMIGGDCAGAYPQYDYREIFRSMAAGIADGVMGEGSRDGNAAGRNLLMSFHPQKPNPRSSNWFHADPWLSFNSIQAWPDDQVKAIAEDWALTPAKPTWIFEGRYEAYYKGNYKPEDWGPWQCRQQAWQTVFAGAFGHTYGHERIFCFGADGWDWKKELDAPGARCMGYLKKFIDGLSVKNSRERVPDQSLLDGDAGKADRTASNRITAMRTRDGQLAMFYISNGRNIHVKLDRLARGPLRGYWFNPRSGMWLDSGAREHGTIRPFAVDINAGPGAAVREFNPPGPPAAGNDWVLLLTAGEGL